MKTYEAVARTLHSHGVDTIFTLLGEGVLWIADEFGTTRGGRVVHAWNDNLAVAMADGWARSSGRTGVAALTLGPGLTSAATSLAVAHKHGTPLLLLVGSPPIAPGFHNQRVDQAAFVESLGIPYTELLPEDDVAARVSAVLRATARGPVVIAVPADLQCAEPAPAGSVRGNPGGRDPRPIEVDDLAGLLRSARRPLLLAGAGAVDAGALAAVAELGDATGAALGTSLRAAGAFVGMPGNVGLVGGFADDAVRTALAECDLVVAFGARFGHYTSSWGEIAPAATVVRVLDRTVDVIDEAPAGGALVVGDALEVAQELLALLGEDAHGAQPWIAPLAPMALRPEESEGLTTYTAAASLAGALREGDSFVLGVGHFWSIVATQLRGLDPARMVFEDDFTAIGQALAMACGVAVEAGGNPVHVVDGDGSIQFNPAALRTIADEALPVCLSVVNDAAYSAEVHVLSSQDRDPAIARHRAFDFAALATAYGIDATTCHTVQAYESALADFTRRPRPVLLDVRVDPSVVSRVYRRTKYRESV